MATRKITLKEKPEGEIATDEAVSRSQRRPTSLRYLLQVDRQTKSSFDEIEEAKAAGRTIKNAFPMVQVSIYDTKESESFIVAASG
jgi:hypothetical protein